MNNYKIYLLDIDNYAQLDVDNLSLSSVFSVADISDLSKRKDSLSKNIKLKGTKNNNQIFGNLYNLNRDVDEKLFVSYHLFFKYKPSLKLDCLVYENDTLIINKGQLQVINVTIDSEGAIEYEAVVTGSIVNFFSLLGGKKLENLNFSEYAHSYIWTNILNSFETSIVKSGSVIPFDLGAGYVYPFIIYDNNDSNYNKVAFTNFRPAIWVREYFNKIFKQPVLSGFTYEVKGDSDFIKDFNSLIIPNNAEKMINSSFSTGTTIQINKTIPKSNGGGATVNPGVEMWRMVNFDSEIDDLGLISSGSFASLANCVFSWSKDVNTDGVVKFNSVIQNLDNPNPMYCYMILGQRDNLGAGDPNYNLFNFTTVAEKYIGQVNPNSTFSGDVTFTIPNNQFTVGKQFVLYYYITGSHNSFTNSSFNITTNSASISFPSLPSNLITYSLNIGDALAPQPPLDVLQTDFIKSIIKMFNFYVYSSLNNPKHIIFERYDDYYSDASALSNSVDWSSKIDYNQSLSLLMNVEADKKYSFEYKEDNDYFNAELYKKRYNTTFGNYTNVSTDGNAKSEKIEVIFSPTPLAKYNDTGRIHPAIYKMESNNTSIGIKSNIRILYYSGVKDCLAYSFVDGAGNDNTSNITTYGACGHLKYAAGRTNYTYQRDLNFGLCKEYFQGINSDIYDIPNLFSNYSNLINELNDPNFLTIECDALLNEIDIANLDFKRSIYISTPVGDSYFKLLEVNYQNSLELSQITLQKINL